MRKITRDAVDAFYGGYNYKNSNTEVIHEGTATVYLLHNNGIARRINDKIAISLAGWNTNTTRERLNGLRGVKVTTKKGQAYLNGEKWDGEWITVNQ